MSRWANRIATMVWIGAAGLSIIGFGYALYRSPVHPPGTMHPWYLLASAGLTLSVFALSRKEKLKINLALIGLSLVSGIYLVEFGLFLAMGELSALRQAEGDLARRLAERGSEHGAPDDWRSRMRQVVGSLRERGIEAYPTLAPLNWLDPNKLGADGAPLFPLGGIARRTTVLCSKDGNFITYQSDEHGFNNPARLYSQGAIHIALIGDSFAQGICVNSPDTIAGQLRRDGQRVLNLGYGGNGPLIELATLREYAEPLRPNVVLWLYYEGNDISNLLAEHQSPLLVKYLDPAFSQHLLDRQDEIDHLLEAIWNTHFKGEVRGRPTFAASLNKLIHLGRLRSRLNVLMDPPPFTFLPPPLLRVVLQEAKTRVSAWGGGLYFVYLPGLERYRRAIQDDLPREQVLSIVRALEIPLIDFHAILATQPDPVAFIFSSGGHYTVEGYRLLGEQIQGALGSRLVHDAHPR